MTFQTLSHKDLTTHVISHTVCPTEINGSEMHFRGHWKTNDTKG